MNLKLVTFIFSLVFTAATYGYVAANYHLFPYSLIKNAQRGYNKVLQILDIRRPWFYSSTDRSTNVTIYHPDAIAPGLTLVSGIAANSQIEARIVNREGDTIHHWNLDWFDLWPDATHISPEYKPTSPPGTHVHGIIFMDNGDLVFNLERTGLYRVDICGNTVWRLPRMTHHSLHLDEDGNFWVPGLDIVRSKSDEFPGYKPPYNDYKILKVSDKGELIGEWSVMSLLKDNGLESLLYMSSTNNTETTVSGDTLHLNDIEIFPSNLDAGKFEPGDVMLSLRNVNTVLIFDNKLKKLKHMFIGPFIRQHDPDFIDGNTISVFDNYTSSAGSELPHSRIVRLSATEPMVEVYFSGSNEIPFFTNIMGKDQALNNGNLLITEAKGGRAIEIDPEKRIVWEYVNLVEKGVVGLIDEAQRLPDKFDKDFFANKVAACTK